MLKDITKQELIQELENRVADKILEPTNFELLKKLIEKADTLDEAIMISELDSSVIENNVIICYSTARE